MTKFLSELPEGLVRRVLYIILGMRQALLIWIFQFARYLVQQINGEANGHFGSSSSDTSDDDDDDVGWLGEPHAGDFEISPDNRASPSFVSSLGAIGNNASVSRRQANSTFDVGFVVLCVLPCR